MALQTVNLVIYSSCIYVLIPNSLEKKKDRQERKVASLCFTNKLQIHSQIHLFPVYFLPNCPQYRDGSRPAREPVNCSVSLKCQEEEQPQFSLKRPGNCILLLLASFNKHLH